MWMKNIFFNLKTLKKSNHDLGDTLLHYRNKKRKLMSTQGAALNKYE